MELLPKHPCLEMLPDTLEMVRREINLDKPGEMKEAVRILDEWVRQQKHFKKKDFPVAYLETSIVMAKGSIERAKLQLDKICTAKTLMPQYFERYDIKGQFQLVRGSSNFMFLPKQTKEYYRLFAGKFVGKYSDPKIMECLYKYIYATLDCSKLYDYYSGVVVIYDVSEVDLKDVIANSNLFELRHCYMTILESYGIRVKRIHLITASKLVDTLISFFKQFLKKKLMDRLIIHKSADELQEYFSKDMLPKEYGGTLKSFLELQDEYLEFLSSEECMRRMKDIFEAKIDESLRPTSQFNDLYAGTYGTFRSLTID